MPQRPDDPSPTAPERGWLERGLALFRPSPARPLIVDADLARRVLGHWRWRMFAGFFVGYALLYFCRKNISTAMPVMARDLGYTNVQLGLIGTTLYVTYGVGKLLNGVLADRANIRLFMASGLIVSGALNLLFGTLHSLWALAFAWGCNGWFQSMGFPPIARGLTLWYPVQGRATRWASWTCSHQAGTAAVMALTAWILTWGSWRDCFRIPGVICLVAGVGLLALLGDTPESVGLPSTRAFADDRPADDPSFDFRKAFVRHVLLNRNVWAVGAIDFCVYVVRMGTLDWTTKFLVEDKGLTIAQAGYSAVLMPVAGVVGVLVSGFVADVLFKSRYRMVNLVSLAMLAVCMAALYLTGRGHPLVDLGLLAAIGFFVEGPQSILGGVGAVDAGGSARVASSAAGLVGICAYAGASLSGIGTGWFVDRFRWGGAFGLWVACAVVGLVLCLVVWKEKPRTT